MDYDGNPSFEPVAGTDLEYADNTGSTVIQSDRTYYLVEDGVWYVSDTPSGPWQVSDYRPQQVDTISPTSPVYNVKYVTIYDSTPDVVYVGYTPGYTGSYVYHNTIVYGTGWYYQPWVSPRYYYPRLGTWGFHANYNSWSGWNFGLSWGWGPFNISYYSGGYWHRNHYWHHRHYGRWGPRGYRPRPVPYGHQGNRYDRYGYRERGYDRGRQARDDVTRQAGNRGSAGRQRGNGQQRKTGRNRTGPVSVDDMRIKARVRDVNTLAASKPLVTDTSGRVYRSADRGKEQGQTRDRKRRSGKTPVNRTMPTPDRNGQKINTRIVSRSDKATRPVSSTRPGRRTNTPVRRTQPRVVNQAPRQKTRVAKSPSRSRERNNDVRKMAAAAPRQAPTRPAKTGQKPIRAKPQKNTRQVSKPIRSEPQKTAQVRSKRGGESGRAKSRKNHSRRGKR